MRIDLFDVPQVNIFVMCALSTNNTTVISDPTNKLASIFRFLNERCKSNVKESIYFKRQNVFAQVSFISYPVPIKDFLDKQDCKIFGDKSNFGR